MTIFFTAAILLTAQVPEYSLSPPGIDFMYLPEYLIPITEGVMTDESGALSGQPNSLGISFSCHYWKMDDPIADKDLWVMEKLSSVLPPDLMETINMGTATWDQGSMNADVSDNRSLGLMSRISFTLSPPGGTMGRGRAYGVFRNGYSVLLMIYGPSGANPQNELDQIVRAAVLSE